MASLLGLVACAAAINDDTPVDAFSFPARTDVAVSTIIESAAIQVTGIDSDNGMATINVTGGEYSIDGNAYTNAASLVRNLGSVKVRHISSASNSTETITTLTIGTQSANFKSTTRVPLGTDTSPDAFSFPAKVNVDVSTVTESTAIQVIGIDAAAAISITNGEYSIDGGTTFTSNAGTVENLASVIVRHTTPDLFATETNTTLTIGDLSGTFKSTTDFFFISENFDVSLDTLTQSNSIALAAVPFGGTFNDIIAISVTNGEYSLDGATFTSNEGTFNRFSNTAVIVRHASSTIHATQTITTLTLGTASADFKSTTIAIPASDTTPDAFSFPTKTDVGVNTLIESTAIQVVGIGGAAAISISNGEYSIDGGSTYTNIAATLENLTSVQVRHTSSANNATENTTTLTIGGVSADFTTITIASSGSSVTVSGIVTFTSFPLLDETGIDYANPVDKPIRGAVIELQNPPGTTVLSANTSDTGTYSFEVPANTTASIIVKAALGTPATPDTKVVDNTSGKALYAISKNITTATSNLTQSFNAGSGWDGSDYTTTRAAAPFAILDVIYQAQKLVESADSTITWTPLIVNWSINNKTSNTIDKPNGDISTSHYANLDDKQLYILGQKNVDTDEYDTHVIGHEWGHYFEEIYSASDSIGGDHLFDEGELLHPSVAFGEAYGYALAGMIMDDPKVIDTTGIAQGASFVNNLETDKVDDAAKTSQNASVLQDGYASEISVAEVLYDIFDTVDESAGTNDTISLGFSPIYKVLTEGQKNTESFTSIFSFLHHLRINQPDDVEAIDALAGAENISSSLSDEFEDSETIGTGLPHLYTPVPTDGSEVTLDDHGDILKVFNTYGVISPSDDGNKLLNQRFFATLTTIAGCYTVTASAVTPATADLKLQIKGFDAEDSNEIGDESKSVALEADKITVFSVSTFESAGATFKVTFASTPSACTS